MSNRRDVTAELMLRGIAITAVVGVHFLAGLPSSIYTSLPFQPLTVFLDQLSRMSVPLFVAMSGFGLTLKYADREFGWGEFLRRRVWKLIPLYVAWSLVYYIVFWFLPSWKPNGTPNSFLVQLVTGRADYQMYFVPMIFQLYILFPFLRQIMKKWPVIFLVGAFVFQVALFAFFTRASNPEGPAAILHSDQQQYVIFASWIFYFILGMFLAQRLQLAKVGWVKMTALTAAVVGLVWSVIAGMVQINSGIDPIIALRFTRWPILLYATGTLTFLLLHNQWLTRLNERWVKTLSFLGKHSYGIYLGHTLFLRIFFSLVNRF